MIQLSSNFSELSENATFHSPDFLPFFLGVGPILFSYGGASTFPTIQNDMEHRDQFNKSVIIGFIGERISQLPADCKDAGTGWAEGSGFAYLQWNVGAVKCSVINSPGLYVLN